MHCCRDRYAVGFCWQHLSQSLPCLPSLLPPLLSHLSLLPSYIPHMRHSIHHMYVGVVMETWHAVKVRVCSRYMISHDISVCDSISARICQV